MNKIIIGHTSYQQTVFDVAKHSIEKRSKDVKILKLDRDALINLGLFERQRSENESTEFAFTRFLSPFLVGYSGWVLFVDNDIICLEDINNLFKYADDKYAVMCVKHDYKPSNKNKLDGQKQTIYPRKNWSSVVLWNAGHPKNRQLTPELISNVSGLYLHRFLWLNNEDIGSIPIEWNYLDGLRYDDINPKLIHYTEGGPYFKNYQNTEYSELWLNEFESMKGRKFMVRDLIDV